LQGALVLERARVMTEIAKIVQVTTLEAVAVKTEMEVEVEVEQQ
jgi:hypothetical protein